MTIPSSGSVSFSDIASEYGMANSNLSLRRLANIGSVYFTNVDSFHGKNYYDFIGSAANITLTGPHPQQDTARGYHTHSTVTTRAMVGLNSSTKNVIYEGGDTTRGGALYGQGGSIYHQAGVGSVGGSGETSAIIPVGWSSSDTREIVNTFCIPNQTKLFIDGEQKDSNPVSSVSELADTNAHGTGNVWQSICATRMTDSDPKTFANGDLRSVHIWTSTVPTNARLYGVQADINALTSPNASDPRPTSLTEATKATIRTAVSLDQNTTGFIYEAGGVSFGLVIYAHASNVYARAGVSGQTGSNEVVWQIPSTVTTSDITTIVYSIWIDSTHSSGKLYINNKLVDSTTGSTALKACGNDNGGTGTTYRETPDTRIGSGSKVFTGTIYETLTWNGVFL